MDILGKEGEKASEAIQNLSNRIEKLETHLNAVDSAVQDTQKESRKRGSEIAEENTRRLLQLEKVMKQLADVQRTSLREIESGRSRQSRFESGLTSRINSLESEVNQISDNQREIESLLERVEKKIFNVEEDLNNQLNDNRGLIEDKVSERKHENELEALRNELSRVKASVNALADDLDDEKIRVE